MTAELCPTCGIWGWGVEHWCRSPYSATTTGGFDPALSCGHAAEIARLRKIEEAARAALAAGDPPAGWSARKRADDALRAALETKP